MVRRHNMPECQRFFIRIALLLILTAAMCSCAQAPGSGFSPAIPYPEVSSDVGDTSFYTPAENASTLENIQSGQVKKVILFVGDGMSFGQVTLARLIGVSQESVLHMERMPVTGYIKTHSADSTMTDSAAAATALACGIKTNNKMVGVDPGNSPCLSILEAARERGMNTGLVATSTISHATPASFATHVLSRNMEAEIAEQIAQSRINVILGGGRNFWLPAASGNGTRSDDIDLIARARESGYTVVNSSHQLAETRSPYVLGLFQGSALSTFSPEPSLPEMTGNAIRLLNRGPEGRSRRSKGFFLMVEGSQIDWAAHKNNARNAVKQVLLFDLAIKTALDFAVEDKTTLIIVTADHETGGLVVRGNNLDWKEAALWATTGHSAMPVPVYAFGPGSESFAGVYDNTEIPKRIAKLLGIASFPAEARF